MRLIFGSPAYRSIPYCTGLIVTLALAAAARGQSPEITADGARTRVASEVRDETFDLPPGAIARLGGSRFSFPDVVNCVAVSPDGKRLVASGRSPDVCVWDLASGKRTLRFHGAERQVGAVAFTADGRQLIVAGDDGILRCFDAVRGEPGEQVNIGVPLVCLAVSPSGRLIASGTADATLSVWDAQLREPLGTWKVGHRGVVTGIAFGTDDKTVLSLATDGHLTCWDLQTKKSLYRVGTRYRDAPSLHFSAQQNLVAVVSGQIDPDRGAIQIMDARTGAEQKRIDIEGAVFRSAMFTSDGKHLAISGAAMRDGKPAVTVEVREWATGRTVWHDEPDSFLPACATMSPDGSILAVGFNDELIRLWDVPSGKELFPRARQIRNVTSLAYAPDGRYLAVASGSMSFDKLGRIGIWETGEVPFHERDHFDCVFPMGLTISEDSRTILAPHFNGTVSRRELESGRLLWEDTSRKDVGLSEVAATVQLDMAANRVYVAQMAGEIRTLDARSGQELQVVRARGGIIFAGLSPDRRVLALAGNRGDVILWDTQRGAEIAALTEHAGKACSLAFSTRGDLLVSGSVDRTVRLWDLRTRAPRNVLKGHREAVHTVAISPSATLIASAGADKEILLWDAAGGRLLRRFSGHEEPITCLCFSPDGQQLASSALDGKVLVWDLGGPANKPDVMSAERNTIRK